MRMYLFGHQSSWNPNSPYRFFLYAADIYSAYTKDSNIYSSSVIRLPAPRFYVFYNGLDRAILDEKGFRKVRVKPVIFDTLLQKYPYDRGSGSLKDREEWNLQGRASESPKDRGEWNLQGRASERSKDRKEGSLQGRSSENSQDRQDWKLPGRGSENPLDREDRNSNDSQLESLWLQLLAGDLYYMTPPGRRTALWEDGKVQYSWKNLVEKAGEIRRAHETQFSGNSRTLLITGEWPLVCEDAMSGNTWQYLEQRGYCLKRAPLTEYLWFLWYDREFGAAKGRAEKVSAAPERLAAFRRMMEQLHRKLGPASAFSGDLDALTETAAQTLGAFTSSNGRYRFAKKRSMAGQVDGIVNAASMYENTDMILKDYDDQIPAPVLNLAFDGVQDSGVRQKLASFLYYL